MSASMESARQYGRAVIALGLLLACCRCAFALDPSLDISQYAHTAWKISEGFGKGTIWTITQTPDGYLWLATEFGLRRFDGVRTVEWQPPAGEHLPSSDIRSLIAARDGTLWIGTAKGLVSWKAGKLTHYPEFDKHDVHSLLEDHEGTVWVAGTIWAAGPSTPGKLCAISRGGVHCFGSDGRFGPFGVTALYEDTRGILWLGASNGLWRLKPGPPQHFPVPELEHYGVAGFVFPRRSFLEDSHGALLITGPRGIRRFIGGKFGPYPLPSDAPKFNEGKLLRDRDGGLWIGTSDAGLLHLHQGRLDVFAQPDGLSSNVVQNLFEDREGNIWVATNNGLDRFRDYAVPTISVKQGLSTPFVTSVLASKDGSVWLGTFDGLNRWQDGQITVYRSLTAGAGASQSAGSIGAAVKSYPTPDGGVRQVAVSGLPDNYVGSLFQEPSGRIWISTARGLAYFEDGKFTSLHGVHIREWFLSPVARDRAGNLWMTSDKGLYRLSGGRVAEFWPSSKVGLRGALSTLLVPDPLNGGLWLGSWQGGIVYWKDGKVRASYGPADGMADASVDDLELDAENTLWAATEGGLSRIKNGHVATLTMKNGLPCDRLYSIAQDDAHSFWMYAACGLMRISRPELDAWVADPKRQIQATILDTSDGVKTHAGVLQYAPRMTKAADGKVWFVTFDGVSVVDPEHLPFNKLPPPVHIERVIADGKTYWQNLSGEASSRSPRLPPRVHDLMIDYTALSFVVPEKVRFRFKLEGQDRDWREVVNDRNVQYSNLAPDNYRFRVTACNNSGVWNKEGAFLDFTIAPAYYQTNWFRALGAAVALALVGGLYRLRVRQLQQQERKFREAIETIPVMAFTALSDGSRTFVNRGWVEYTGLNVEQAAGLGWQAAVHPDDVNRVLEKWRMSVASGEPLEYEARFRGAGGEYRWFQGRAVPLRDERGNILRWYGVMTDIEDRKQTEQALERSEAYLAEAQRLTHTGSFAYNPGSGKSLFWSEEVFRICGLDPRHGIPDPDKSRLLVHPDDRDRVRESALKGFREKANFTTDYRLVLQEGTLKHLRVIWHPVLDQDGEVVEYVGTAADVTERKQAEEALRRSREYLSEAQSLSHMGSFGWKPSTGEIQWSEETYRIFQYDPTTKPALELVAQRIHPEDRALAQQTIARASQEEKDYEHEYRLLMPDGSVKYLHIVANALSNESGGVEFFGAVMDVTAAKQAEERVRQSEAELRQLIDAIPQQVFVFDANWNPLFANQRDREYTGLTLEEVHSKDAIGRVFHPDDLKNLEALRQRMLRENVPYEMEARIRGKDGQYRWFLIRDNPLRDEQGRVLRWYGTRTDIEERKQAEEALRQAQTELAHVTRIMTMGELAASIAHEVNQPLSGVVVNANACLRWLAGHSPNLDEAREAVRRIVRDGKRAGDVIARIRALATKTAIAKERLDMNEAIREVVALARDELRKNSVAVRTEFAPDLSLVLGDRVQIQLVVLNLVMNGIEAMSSVEERPRELIVKTQNDDAGQVRVTVQDSGIGLDPQSMERIFEAFYTTKHGGMGLGLSISRSIIQNHGGKLWAVANDGPGISVQFTVPKYQQ